MAVRVNITLRGSGGVWVAHYVQALPRIGEIVTAEMSDKGAVREYRVVDVHHPGYRAEEFDEEWMLPPLLVVRETDADGT